MTRVNAESKHFFTFVKGIITEATGVTYPENAMVDGSNVDIASSGICQRRFGLNYENNYNLLTPTFTEDEITSNAITFHEWRAVKGNGAVNFWLIQIGTRILWGDMMDTSFSAGYQGEFDLDSAAGIELSTVVARTGERVWEDDYFFDEEPHRTSGGLRSHYIEREVTTTTQSLVVNTNNAQLHPLSSSYGKGRLFFTSRFINPFYMELNETDGTIDLFPIVLRERDFQGVEDNLKIDEQPSELTPEHRYNLKNQGWSDTGATSAGSSLEEVKSILQTNLSPALALLVASLF